MDVFKQRCLYLPARNLDEWRTKTYSRIDHNGIVLLVFGSSNPPSNGRGSDGRQRRDDTDITLAKANHNVVTISVLGLGILIH
jgi:hypothetical protein